jgi:putative PEP-CTERM system histidine kinase
MTILAFILLSFITATVLLILNLFKSGLKPFHPPLILLWLLFPASFFCAFNIYPLGHQSPLWMKWFVAFSFASACSTIDLISCFYRYHIVDKDGKPRKKSVVSISWRICWPFAVIGSFFIGGGAIDSFAGAEFFVLTPHSAIVFYAQLFLQVYILFVLENIFRFASVHQRRIGRMFLLALVAMTLFQGVFLIRCILYKTIILPYLTTNIAITGICFPTMLLGLLRVRIGSFEIGISRQSIYSSLTFFVFGAFCLAIGSASYLVRALHLEFTFFEAFLLLFSAFFFTILAFLSEDMRRRIRSFVNSHIFIRKFDYREQFFWLHQSYMTGDDVDESISILSAHLLYTMNYENLYVFLINPGDGNFHLHKDPKKTPGRDVIITGDNPIIKEFFRDKDPLQFTGANLEQRDRAIFTSQRETIEKLGITAIFPIFHQNTLLGLLAAKYRNNNRLDMEDKMLISIFTVSIGNVFFKYHMLRENIENKQFESFNRLAAFMVHDIKNQVATLSLVMKNAEKNIHNPEFQKSLIVSIQSCANNLQSLIDKLASPPKGDHLGSQSKDINEIVIESINATGIMTLKEVQLTSVLHAPSQVPVDRESLYYILKNLIVNALEAMNNKGALTIATGDCNLFTEKLQKEFTIGEHFLRKYRAYIFLEDTGVGMSKEFINERLFRPFSTTKDKGIGIGLYQCKILVEKMGGVLLCVSQPNAGTKFCILL